MSRPTLTTTIQHGTLAHVLSIGGKAFQSFTTRAAALCALALALELAGCAAIERHPRISAFVAGSLVLTAGGALRNHHDDADRHISIEPVSCASESCK